MLESDEKALICDFAETYHIFDIRQFRAAYIATLANGLNDDSRIKRGISGQKAKTDTLLFAILADRLAAIFSSVTGAELPPSIYDALCGIVVERTKKYEIFESGEEFLERMKQIQQGE